MKRDWIKLQLDILNDPTYGLLPDDQFRRLMELYLLAGEKDQEGLLPGVENLAWRLRVDPEELLVCLWGLLERGLVDETPQGWVVTGFKESQAAPNSTERSRTSRRRRFKATEPDEKGDEVTVQSTAQCGTGEAVEMQRSSPYPVAVPDAIPVAVLVPAPNPVPGQPKLPGRARHRHKTKKRPVEKPVDNFVEKGRKISVSPESTSSSSLTNSLKTSLNLKLPLLELPGPETEIFRLSQGKTLKNKRINPGTTHFAGVLKAPQGRIDQGAGQMLTAPKAMQEPVDKIVDNFVEKGRKNSDPVKIPP